MTATGHALVGALIAGKVGDPVLTAALAFLSHFPCDILPHWDVGMHHVKKKSQTIFYEAVADVLVSYAASFLLFWYILGQRDLILLAVAVFAAHLPDWISFPYFLWKIKFFPFVAMHHVQERMHHTLDKPWGIVTQVALIVILYLLLYVLF